MNKYLITEFILWEQTLKHRDISYFVFPPTKADKLSLKTTNESLKVCYEYPAALPADVIILVFYERAGVRCEITQRKSELIERTRMFLLPGLKSVRHQWHGMTPKKGQSKWTNTANTSMQICIVWPTHTSNWIAPWCVDRNRPHGFTRPKIKSCHGFYTYSMMYMTTVQGHIPAHWCRLYYDRWMTLSSLRK